MKKFILSVVVFLVAGQAHAFIKAHQKYECQDGRRFNVNSSMDQGIYGMEFYYEAGSNEYYEGSILIITPSEAHVYHHEGDKVGTIRVGGFKRVCINVDRKNTCCMLRRGPTDN